MIYVIYNTNENVFPLEVGAEVCGVDQRDGEVDGDGEEHLVEVIRGGVQRTERLLDVSLVGDYTASDNTM